MESRLNSRTATTSLFPAINDIWANMRKMTTTTTITTTPQTLMTTTKTINWRFYAESFMILSPEIGVITERMRASERERDNAIL